MATVRRFSSQTENKNESKEKEKNNEQSRQAAPSRRTALRWVIQNVKQFSREENEVDRPDPQLIVALDQLFHARTQRELAQVGRTIESLEIQNTESIAVQERVIRALSIVGLVSLALELLDGILSQGILPSPICYVAVCEALRQMGRFRRIEELLCQMGYVGQRISGNEKIDVVALNCYLAALCEEATQKGPTARMQHGEGDVSLLRTAWKWLEPGRVQGILGTGPDVASYNIVMNAALSVNDQELAEKAWNEIQLQEFQPNAYTYNARIKAALKEGRSADASVLSVFDQLLEEPSIQPDRFTIDLVCAPLVRSGRIGDVQTLLDDFVDTNGDDGQKVSNAFASFLNTLVKAQEVPMAQTLFDTYLVIPRTSTREKALNRAFAGVRHFNILIEGYRQKAKFTETNDRPVGSVETIKRSVEKSTEEARRKAWSLYSKMGEAGLKPDTYTMTSMFGIATSPDELSRLLKEAAEVHRVEFSSAVLRAAMTRYGEVGDPSSACWLFLNLCHGTSNRRTWNVFLGALASGSGVDTCEDVQPSESRAAAFLSPSLSKIMDASDIVFRRDANNEFHNFFMNNVDGASCREAVISIFNVMARNVASRVIAPKPDSQTYCIVASAMQHGASDPAGAMNLFRNATQHARSADGRFINAVFRCFGEDINSAISAWKGEIRKACFIHENRSRKRPVSLSRKAGKNLIASYHGLLYVCGRALRPDIAVRLVYAMNKEGLDADETALNCYSSGKRKRAILSQRDGLSGDEILKEDKLIRLGKQYESLLQVECAKYDANDKRRENDRRIRIIF